MIIVAQQSSGLWSHVALIMPIAVVSLLVALVLGLAGPSHIGWAP